jgi:hypothetical protein
VQAASRDVFAEHLLKLKAIPGLHILFTVHDEVVIEVEDESLIKTIEDIMRQTPSWLQGCPISCEAKVVKHYLK